MTFVEQRETAAALIRDVLCGGVIDTPALRAGLSIRHGQMLGAGWHHMVAEPQPRSLEALLTRDDLVAALLRLNDEALGDEAAANRIVAQMGEHIARARITGIESAHVEFMQWLRGEGLPGAPGLRLLDFDDPAQNSYALCTAMDVTARGTTQRVDILLFINGIPLVAIQTGPGAEILEAELPELLVPVVYSVSAAGDDIGAGDVSGEVESTEEFEPVPAYRGDGPPAFSPLSSRTADAVTEMLRPAAVLEAVLATK